MEIDDAHQMAGAGRAGGGRARDSGLREHVNRRFQYLRKLRRLVVRAVVCRR
jgi:hypothetical protein